MKKSDITAMITAGGKDVTVGEFAALAWGKLISVHHNYNKKTGKDHPSSVMQAIKYAGVWTNEPLKKLDEIQAQLNPEIDGLTEQEAKDELKKLIPHVVHLYSEAVSTSSNANVLKHELNVVDSVHAQITGSKNKGIKRPSAQKKTRPIIIAAMKQMRLDNEKIQFKELLKIWEGDANSDSFEMRAVGNVYTFDCETDNGLHITETYTNGALEKMFSEAKPTA
jgi:hypothetical protein